MITHIKVIPENINGLGLTESPRRRHIHHDLQSLMPNTKRQTLNVTHITRLRKEARNLMYYHHVEKLLSKLKSIKDGKRHII